VFILSALSWICSSTEVVEAVGNCISKAGESVNQSIQLVLCIRHVPSLILAATGMFLLSSWPAMAARELKGEALPWCLLEAAGISVD
jgi:hypothetical protein